MKEKKKEDNKTKSANKQKSAKRASLQASIDRLKDKLEVARSENNREGASILEKMIKRMEGLKEST